VLLKFRPDGGNVPQKVIELVLLGNKIILDLEETPLAATHYAVQKANIFSGFGDHYAHVAMQEVSARLFTDAGRKVPGVQAFLDLED